MEDSDIQAQRMQRAIALAAQAWGETHPNPMVGALIVESGQVVAEGWHHASGQPHAEIEALRALGRPPKPDAVLYVTLEPCSTCGRTGACTDAILESGIRQVVVGATDPNPAHAGAGFARLREAGVKVITGVCEDACEDLNLIFNHIITRQSPMFAMKLALTLDGKFAAASGASQWVTGSAARADVMRWRRYFPAIAVGVGTALADNPQLTSRIDETVWCPQRFILDRALLSASADLKMFSDAYVDRTTVVCGESADPERKAMLEARGIQLLTLPEKESHLDLLAWKRWLWDAEIPAVYIEAGPGLASGLIESGILDYSFIYQAPKFMSDQAAVGIGSRRETTTMSDAFELYHIQRAQFGPDALTRGWLHL